MLRGYLAGEVISPQNRKERRVKDKIQDYAAKMFTSEGISSSKNFQTASTEAISTRSLGEWGFLIVGPTEIISIPGIFSPMTAGSRPA